MHMQHELTQVIKTQQHAYLALVGEFADFEVHGVELLGVLVERRLQLAVAALQLIVLGLHGLVLGQQVLVDVAEVEPVGHPSTERRHPRSPTGQRKRCWPC